jgi:hypothetical protein
MKIYGMNVFVMSKDELIAYKTALGRDVDKIDVDQMKATENF